MQVYIYIAIAKFIKNKSVNMTFTCMFYDFTLPPCAARFLRFNFDDARSFHEENAMSDIFMLGVTVGG